MNDEMAWPSPLVTTRHSHKDTKKTAIATE
jgi:hypothetical protein